MCGASDAITTPRVLPELGGSHCHSRMGVLLIFGKSTEYVTFAPPRFSAGLDLLHPRAVNGLRALCPLQ